MNNFVIVERKKQIVVGTRITKNRINHNIIASANVILTNLIIFRLNELKYSSIYQDGAGAVLAGIELMRILCVGTYAYVFVCDS